MDEDHYKPPSTLPGSQTVAPVESERHFRFRIVPATLCFLLSVYPLIFGSAVALKTLLIKFPTASKEAIAELWLELLMGLILASSGALFIYSGLGWWRKRWRGAIAWGFAAILTLYSAFPAAELAQEARDRRIDRKLSEDAYDEIEQLLIEPRQATEAETD